MIDIKCIQDYNKLYLYQLNIVTPFIYKANYDEYLISLLNDVDSEGNKLFKELHTIGAYINDNLVGFIQYGISNIGFDNNGDIYEKINYQIIRQIYFTDEEVGKMLIEKAFSFFNSDETIYAFFHYFGMSCFGAHGKLYYKNNNIEKLLMDYGFEVEHENVCYSLNVKDNLTSNIKLQESIVNKANKQNIRFLENDHFIGECEIHYVDDENAYLRWIYIDNNIQHKGFGSKCMDKLQSYLFNKGIIRLHTDTANNNLIAQKYYEKNGFINKGITKSYYKEYKHEC